MTARRGVGQDKWENDRPQATAPIRSLSTDDDDGPVRRCDHCERPLPAGSRSTRRFCSTACRVRSWDEANRPPWDESPEPVPLHWHLGGYQLLAGNATDGHWRGPGGCPPGCPGLKPPHTTSQAIPEGREGWPPLPYSTEEHP